MAEVTDADGFTLGVVQGRERVRRALRAKYSAAHAAMVFPVDEGERRVALVTHFTRPLVDPKFRPLPSRADGSSQSRMALEELEAPREGSLGSHAPLRRPLLIPVRDLIRFIRYFIDERWALSSCFCFPFQERGRVSCP